MDDCIPSFVKNSIPISKPTDKANNVFGRAEAYNVADDVSIVFDTVVKAPLALNCGHVIKQTTMPIIDSVYPV